MFDCKECKNYGTEVCDNCSLNTGDKCCTCFQMAPCGYCENILYEDKE